MLNDFSGRILPDSDRLPDRDDTLRLFALNPVDRNFSQRVKTQTTVFV